MDASTILYIVLGLGALILQGYMEKKKKEQARQRHQEETHEDFHEELHDEPSIHDIFPSLPNLFNSTPEQVKPIDEVPEKRVEYSMIDIPVSQEYSNEEIAEEGISSFRHELNVAQELAEEKNEEPSFTVDPRNLVLYSEIMAPKFRE